MTWQYLIGQIKKNQNSRAALVSPGGWSGQTKQKCISLRCDKIRPAFLAEASSQTWLFVHSDVNCGSGSQSANPSAFNDEQENGGARRDRTDDLMLAKHALSQLSYGPEGKRYVPEAWWARVDSNYRPHAYQACALTT